MYVCMYGVQLLLQHACSQRARRQAEDDDKEKGDLELDEEAIKRAEYVGGWWGQFLQFTVPCQHRCGFVSTPFC